MKRFLIRHWHWLVCYSLLLSIPLFVYWTRTSAEERAKQHQEAERLEVNRVKSGLIYFKDDRTGLCFAYYWGGDPNGGPALTVVPEEKVAHLLIK